MNLIDGWVKDWAENREDNECFGDFAIRSKIVKPVVDPAVDFWDESKLAG